MCIGKVSSRFNRRRAALADPRLCSVLRFLPTRAVLIEFDIAAKIPLFLHIIKLFAPLIASSFSVTIFSDMVSVSFRMFVVQLHSTRWRWPCPLFFLGDCFHFSFSGICATYCTLSVEAFPDVSFINLMNRQKSPRIWVIARRKKDAKAWKHSLASFKIL